MAVESPDKEKGEQKEPWREEASSQPAPRSSFTNCRSALREAQGAARDRRERRQEAQWSAVSRVEAKRGKVGSRKALFLSEMALRSLKTALRSEQGDRQEQVACQVADLALEMTEDALRKASMCLRRCASERALRRSCTADSASWDH